MGQFCYIRGYDCGAGLHQEVPVTEAPFYRDAVHCRVSCCGYVHLGIAYIDGILTIDRKLVQNVIDGIRSRLFSYVGPLASGSVQGIAEMFPAKDLNG